MGIIRNKRDCFKIFSVLFQHDGIVSFLLFIGSKLEKTAIFGCAELQIYFAPALFDVIYEIKISLVRTVEIRASFPVFETSFDYDVTN